MFTECSHSVKSSQILPSGDVALGKKWHTRQNSQNQNQFGSIRCFTECYTDRISVLPSATLGKICPQIFFCFSAYPVTISNKITGNYNNMTDRQYISHICPQMSHPLTITNICRQAPCKVHKHHQHMSKVHKVQPSPQFNIQTHQTRSDGLSHGRRPAEKRSQVQVLITLHIVVRSSCRRSLE